MASSASPILSDWQYERLRDLLNVQIRFMATSSFSIVSFDSGADTSAAMLDARGPNNGQDVGRVHCTLRHRRES
ncbi:MAG TPA: hypothetical protein VMP68_02780 [Candidatus Eisenbacteria bacterium]|nr:hypothetical protein [Candidatus Eisenbacteria bacterium]